MASDPGPQSPEDQTSDEPSEEVTPVRPARTRTDAAGRRPAARRRPAAGTARRARPAETPPRTGPGAPKAPASQKKLVVILSALTVAVVALAAFAVAISSGGDDPLPPPASSIPPVPVMTFTDRATGFTVDYPRSWRQVDVPNAEYRLAVDGGNNVAMTIRVVPVAEVATAANLQNFKAVTDGYVGLNDTVTILKQQAVTYNGMLGYYYFYTFRDGAVEAVHSHYFLFSGKKMNIIVFQSFPDDFERIAPTFDRVAESFRSDPKVELVGAPVIAGTTTVP